MAESVLENDEFLQVALAAHEAAKQQETPEALQAAPPEHAKEEQPKTAEPAAGDNGVKLVEDENSSETMAEDKSEEKKPDWKAAVAASRAKRSAKEQTKQQNAQLQSEVSAIRSELQRYKDLEILKESDPLQAAEKFGLNYDRLTQEYIKTLEKNPNLPPPHIRALDQNFQRVQERVELLEKELATERSQKAVNVFISDVKNMLATKADEFELTKTAEEGPELVKQIAILHWQQTAKFDQSGKLLSPGEEMPIEEACRLAEKYFENQQLKRFAETKKFKALLKPEPAPKTPVVPPPKPLTSTATLSQQLRQGGGEQTNFSGEWDELAALAKKLETQLGN